MIKILELVLVATMASYLSKSSASLTQSLKIPTATILAMEFVTSVREAFTCWIIHVRWFLLFAKHSTTQLFFAKYAIQATIWSITLVILLLQRTPWLVARNTMDRSVSNALGIITRTQMEFAFKSVQIVRHSTKLMDSVMNAIQGGDSRIWLVWFNPQELLILIVKSSKITLVSNVQEAFISIKIISVLRWVPSVKLLTSIANYVSIATQVLLWLTTPAYMTRISLLMM